MAHVAVFTFNPFQENTYVVYDDTKSCAIIDPGCFSKAEQEELSNFIETLGLKPTHLLNTHCHIDHILGNKFVQDKYGLPLRAHKGEIPVLKAGRISADMYNIPYEDSPEIEIFLEEGEMIKVGDTSYEVLFTPGHSPASVSYLNKEHKILIGGDVLFKGGVGRVDLPGGNGNTLMKSIIDQFMVLPDDIVVYSGHMGETTIGEERSSNPYIRAFLNGEDVF